MSFKYMKSLLLNLLIICLSINSFSQNSEDENLASINEVYFLDSCYVKYDIDKSIIRRTTYETDYNDMLIKNIHVTVMTDEYLSSLLTDSIAKFYHVKQKFKQKKQLKSIYSFLDDIAIDSSLNVLFYRVESPCEPCRTSILENTLSDKDVVNFLYDGKIKYVYVNYYQTIRNKRFEFLVITVKFWFKKEKNYTLYSEKN